MFRRVKYIIVFMIGAVLAFGAVYIPLPYYITKPGLADELDPYVKVANGYKEDGDFMLVTVSMSQANIISYIVANFSKYQEIYEETDIFQQGETDEHYHFRQLHMMEESQVAAIYNAYKKANQSVSFENEGVVVVALSENMPAHEKLQIGDILIGVDGKKLQTADEFIDYVTTKQEGDIVEVTYIRDEKEETTSLALKAIENVPDRVGIGVQIVTDRKLKTEPKVEIDSRQIGGPSAGLMFTLEIMDQLTDENMTKGRKIAGTGTIDQDGNIGPIGGISQKVIAASDAGAEIFFAPNENGKEGSNYQEAIKTAEDIGTNMKIVPVDTLDDALDYLKTL